MIDASKFARANLIEGETIFFRFELASGKEITDEMRRFTREEFVKPKNVLKRIIEL